MPAKGDYDEDADRHAATKTALGRQNAQLLRQVQQDRDLIHFQVRVVFVIAHQCDPYRGQLEISQQQLADHRPMRGDEDRRSECARGADPSLLPQPRAAGIERRAGAV